MDWKLGAEIAAGAAAVAGLAAGGCAYAAMWPTSRIFGRALTAPRRPGELALTFDDGPNPEWTPRLLDLLAEHKVRGSFFLLGKHAALQPELVRRMAAEGHLIGNHSWSHPNLARTPAAQVREELRRTRDLLAQQTGAPIKHFRPPYGGRRPVVLRIGRELGMEPVLWNAMTTDWKDPDGAAVASRLEAKIAHWDRRGRATTLVLHDGAQSGFDVDRAPSLRAARLLLERFTSCRRFVTVAEWV